MTILQGALMQTAEVNDPVQKPFATSGDFDVGFKEMEDRSLLKWDWEVRPYDLHPVVRDVVWRGLGEAVKERVYEGRFRRC